MNEGRRIMKDGRPDGSFWRESIGWNDATGTSGPVASIVLLYVHTGAEAKSADGDSLGWRWRFQVVVADFRGLEFPEIRRRMRDAGAIWWAYIPNGPPANIVPVPWDIDAEGNPVVHPANDPQELDHVYNVPPAMLTELKS